MATTLRNRLSEVDFYHKKQPNRSQKNLWMTPKEPLHKRIGELNHLLRLESLKMVNKRKEKSRKRRWKRKKKKSHFPLVRTGADLDIDAMFIGYQAPLTPEE